MEKSFILSQTIKGMLCNLHFKVLMSFMVNIICRTLRYKNSLFNLITTVFTEIKVFKIKIT